MQSTVKWGSIMNKKDIRIDNIGELFFEFQAKLQFFERKFLKEYHITDLTPNEVKVLYIVGISNIKSMSEIANKLKVTHGTLSIVVNSLSDKGYVIRNRHKQDRRIIVLYLTRKSINVIRLYGHFYYELISNLIQALDLEQSLALEPILENLNQIIETNFYEGTESYEEDNE